VNFRSDVARGLADGLAHLGGALGVPIEDEDCNPNIFIVGTEDGRALAEEWVRRDYRDFRPNTSRAALSPSRLTDFIEMETPVRWWAISRPTYFDIYTGRTVQTSNLTGGGPPPRIPVYARSMMSARTRDDLQWLVVILDVAQMEQTQLEDLIAYLALVVFSQVDMGADMRAHDTILNLFNGTHTGGGLTQWDRAYLASMYAAPEDLRLNEHRQAERLARRLRTGDDGSSPD
jgi:hypothetical protein